MIVEDEMPLTLTFLKVECLFVHEMAHGNLSLFHFFVFAIKHGCKFHISHFQI